MSGRLPPSSEILKAFDDSAFPAGFLEQYDQLECLSASNGTETFLVQQRASEKLAVAKCCDKTVYRCAEEGAILRALDHRGLPAFFDEFENGDMICVVREYVFGTPLDRAAHGRAFSGTEAADICIQLCDILTYIHSRETPVIHRDIKPENVILQPDGTVALIDFGISRTFDSESETDTVFIGTRLYAPPEQYGFAQTDARADIYSLGVLLRWMLTGSPKKDPGAHISRPLERIIEKCTAFAPNARYRDAAAVKKALVSFRSQKGGRAPVAAAFCIALFAALAAGFAVGRYTPLLSPAFKSGAVAFSQSAVERAVRVQLGKAEGDEISDQELLTVRELYIFGDQVSKTGEEFAEGLSGELAESPRGGLRSLEDVLLLPNLETLFVNYQELSDISAIAGLECLETVNFRHTRIEDVSALSGMQSLRRVCLFDTNVSDISCLDSCPRLWDVELGSSLVDSAEKLAGFDSVRSLSLKDLNMVSLKGMERFLRLEQLNLSNTAVKDLSPLLSLPNLKTVIVDGSMKDAVGALGEGVSFSVIYE